jgi:hypothetical protein
MRKIAIFVEGQSELIFIRELLLKFYDWQNVWIECYTLFNNVNLNPTEYSIKNEDASIYYQILNIGNDRKVLSSILKRESYLFSENQSFDKVIGLRDMYSKEYREEVKTSSVDETINQKFIDGRSQTIKTGTKNPDKIRFHFAIMELETWILGIDSLFSSMKDKIAKELGFDLNDIELETDIFHPAKVLDRVMQIVDNSGYDKKSKGINMLMSRISKEDFIRLLDSERCKSFNEFYNSLEIPNHLS